MADTKIKSSTAAGNLYLYDRIINLKLFHKTDEDKNISIECNAYGMKPDITLEIIEIPNNSCFQAVVQVRNLIIDDVRSYTSMSIEAGYYGLNMTKVAEVDTTYGKQKAMEAL